MISIEAMVGNMKSPLRRNTTVLSKKLQSSNMIGAMSGDGRNDAGLGSPVMKKTISLN